MAQCWPVVEISAVGAIAVQLDVKLNVSKVGSWELGCSLQNTEVLVYLV